MVGGCHLERKVPLRQYIEKKIELLRDFGIRLTEDADNYIHGLKDEVSVDKYVHDIIKANL